MSNKILSIIEELKSLTLLEAAKLVKEIEQTFDVNASLSSLVILLFLMVMLKHP